ncbi:hypothetical protein PFFCH_03772 [Plasmodium falciparum FCH/4]|uniref:Surface antigen n=1 Tax=Plasmodium falciparum FCH/4 TaxID=1036724 RepID=A0A024VJW2_PLAFA|nr:hypothetical protein PFFCH_03772 [Plasmodium falciparum FCH/4]
MKVHYINILLFALPLNILVRSPQKNPFITQKIPTTRLLCECELYAPSNYDNDPEMKAVMQGFDRQTSQRFEEYNERLLENKQKCREQCDKEIEKIILKDKLEKQMAQQLTTLETKIDTNDIPTCVCEKSLADKTEKFCLNCGVNVGGGVTLSSGVLGGIGAVAVNAWKDAALEAAIDFATKAGAAAGEAAGMKAGIQEVMKGLYTDFRLSAVDVKQLGLAFDGKNYNNAKYIFEAIFTKYQGSCMGSGSVRVPVTGTSEPICKNIIGKAISGRSSEEATIKSTVKAMVSNAEATAQMTTETTTKEAISTLTIEKTGEVNATYGGCQTAITASVIAILIIVLVMIIIYLILRYRRKKKMKKKLQYIKLLEE